MKFLTQPRMLLGMTVLSALLAGCGGGESGGASYTVTVPKDVLVDMTPRYPETGFLSGVNAGPLRDTTPASADHSIWFGDSNLSSTTVIIYMPGVQNPEVRQDCSSDIPVALGWYRAESPATRLVYYLCSNVVASQTYNVAGITGHIDNRAQQFKTAIAQMTAAGISPKNIFIAGHSAGAWSALKAAFSILDPASFGGVIAFAPAFTGETVGRPAVAVSARNLAINTIKASSSISSILFAYDDDAFEPTDSNFTQAIAAKVDSFFSANCEKGHASPFFPTASDEACMGPVQGAIFNVGDFIATKAGLK